MCVLFVAAHVGCWFFVVSCCCGFSLNLLFGLFRFFWGGGEGELVPVWCVAAAVGAVDVAVAVVASMQM